MRLHSLPQHVYRFAVQQAYDYRYRRLTQQVVAPEYRRIYHFHIRKTGGTSINKMFFALSGEDASDVHLQLLRTNPRQIIAGRHVFVGWQQPLIEKGSYFFAFSHIPQHQLKLPPDTFTFTCFRDPIKRVISHYRMLLMIREKGGEHQCFASEGQWLGNSFDEFLERLPREHLLNQLYMFSKNFQVDEAVEQIERLDHYLFLDDFDSGIEELNQAASISLKPLWYKRDAAKFSPTKSSIRKLRTLLSDEYRLMDLIRNQSSISKAA